mmetsp:Transcript_38765/g.93074  ORF Transcript_38765/g.93074 Transcript_38765/m.93074 type:complete len:221 (+) Transcript_38765:43-705(+)
MPQFREIAAHLAMVRTTMQSDRIDVLVLLNLGNVRFSPLRLQQFTATEDVTHGFHRRLALRLARVVSRLQHRRRCDGISHTIIAEHILERRSIIVMADRRLRRHVLCCWCRVLLARRSSVIRALLVLVAQTGVPGQTNGCPSIRILRRLHGGNRKSSSRSHGSHDLVGRGGIAIVASYCKPNLRPIAIIQGHEAAQERITEDKQGSTGRGHVKGHERRGA